MSTYAILSALCYFSLFFAPFLFPVVVYFVVKDECVMRDARNSFLSHLIPLLSLPILLVIVIGSDDYVISTIVAIVVYGLLAFAVMVWNLVKGIQALLRNRS
ncbi:MAG TPA: hypothetical protein VFJ73_01750 [Bacillales bacterium]|nr:hypothetical protein [Bacillales bacterium]